MEPGDKILMKTTTHNFKGILRMLDVCGIEMRLENPDSIDNFEWCEIVSLEVLDV